MLALTKIKRTHIIDHVMPSDLDDKDIKHGLYLKEKMISEITDDYIKQNFPEWKELERTYRKRGLTETIDKILCGEMSINDIETPKPVRCEVWMRWKEFETNPGTEDSHVFIPQNKREDDFSRWEAYDFDRLSGYSDWIKSDENGTFSLRDKYDIMVQFQIAIIGENSIRYYPFQDSTHYSGFNTVDDNVQLYDTQLWSRVETPLTREEFNKLSNSEKQYYISKHGSVLFDDLTDEQKNYYNTNGGKLLQPIDTQEQYYRLFFRNYKGFYTYEFFNEDQEWINNVYGDEAKDVRTIQTDTLRIKYIGKRKPDTSDWTDYGSYCVLDAKQWVKCNYHVEMCSIATFRLVLDNLHYK